MIEFSFRGKSIHSGDLVQGYHIYYPNGITDDGNPEYAIVDTDKNFIYSVDPETIRQCTSVPDKNGKMIFGGDIVKRKRFDDYIIGEVVWLNIGHCGFLLKCGNSFYPIGKDEHTGRSDCDEIIGNIFDNPDMLEELEGE